MIEDLIAKNVNAIIVVPNDAKVLEPVLKKARDKGIVVLTHESPDQQIGQWDIETIDSENTRRPTSMSWRKTWVAKAATRSTSAR